MSKLAKALTAAAGNAGGDNLYVEDVFSTYLYEGTGATQSIDNGIDLDGEGGLVWIKNRGVSAGWGLHFLFDTERSPTNSDNMYYLQSSSTNPQSGTNTDTTKDFGGWASDGFLLGSPFSLGADAVNGSGSDYASWTFRKAEKFFDVVTYTGNGANGREISHNLNGDVGMVIVKCTSDSDQWLVWHKSTPTGYLRLDGTGALVTSFAQFKFGNGTTTVNPTSSVFTVAGDSDINGSGRTYVAYLFAHDAGGFGDDGSESIIKCGSYTTNGSGQATVSLGYEPQWLLVKSTSSGDDWKIVDNMRGFLASGNSTILMPNLSSSESTTPITLTSTGFSDNGAIIANGTVIYIAIRRPMKTPESGTEVFAPAVQGVSGANPTYPTGIVTDFSLTTQLFGSDRKAMTRLLGATELVMSDTSVEGPYTNAVWDYMNGWGNETNQTDKYSWGFKRATGFFDVVAYTGTGSATTQAHNLGVAPEFIIVKQRATGGTNWRCYHSANAATNGIALNLDLQSFPSISYWNDTPPTSSVFSVGTSTQVNASGGTYIAYLFATVAGVSKVGSYTGTGSNVDVDCGFSAGARFILIKRTDSTGDWYYWDSVRGIVAGNDPYLLLNSTAAEVTSTDYIDPLASGFTVTSSAPAALNASGGTYIFLAIA